MATDFLLTLAAGGFAALLVEQAGEDPRPLRWIWAAAFGVSAVAAAGGGVFHGFRQRMSLEGARVLWRATLLLSSLTAFLLLLGPAAELRPLAAGLLLAGVALLKLVFVLSRLRHSDNFGLVGVDAGVSLLLILVVVLWQLASGAIAQEGWWIIAGALVALAGGVVQRRPWHTAGGFNQNDLFHVAQALACYLLYRGVSG